MRGSGLSVAMGYGLGSVLEMSWSPVGPFFEVILRSGKRDKKQARFQNDLRPSWRRPGGVLEAAWTCLGASWRLPRTSLATFFSVWKPYRRHDCFWNDVKPSRTSFFHEFCNEKQCGPSNNHDANVSEGQTCRKSKHIVTTHGLGCCL